MTRTITKSSNTIQKTLLCAAFVVAGLMAATTSAGAATRINEKQMNWNKRNFVNFCTSQRQQIVCKKKPYTCSCDDKEQVYRYFWRPNDPRHVFRLLRVPPTLALSEIIGGDGREGDGGGGAGGGGKGRP